MIRRGIADLRKFSPLKSSPLEALANRFVHSFRGTAKGIPKLKPVHPMKKATKKSKVAKKKPVAEPPPPPPKESVIRKSELDQLVEDCLNAPEPLRCLTPKQKAREAEREKLGLISKNRQREIDMLKQLAKKGKKEAPAVLGTRGLDFVQLGLVDAEKIPKYELTVEDGRRLASEYSRVLMREHRVRGAAKSALLRLKKEAIEALPEHLKAAALLPDLAPFPADRFMATVAPPIEEEYPEDLKEAR